MHICKFWTKYPHKLSCTVIQQTIRVNTTCTYLWIVPSAGPNTAKPWITRAFCKQQAVLKNGTIAVLILEFKTYADVVHYTIGHTCTNFNQCLIVRQKILIRAEIPTHICVDVHCLPLVPCQSWHIHFLQLCGRIYLPGHALSWAHKIPNVTQETGAYASHLNLQNFPLNREVPLMVPFALHWPGTLVPSHWPLTPCSETYCLASYP